MSNLTLVREFILMGFPADESLSILHSLLFSLIYSCSLMGNVLIIIIITWAQHLHTPMYFFLKNLSFLDLCMISVTVPKSIANSVTQDHSISFRGCATQVFFFILTVATELHLLTVMSFDRYTAICRPLHYDLIMNRCLCVQMTAGSWLGGFLFGVMHTASTFSFSFCGSNVIHQFFCDIPQLLAISCSKSFLRETVTILVGVVVGTFCFMFVVITYVYIFSTVRNIPSSEGRSKAFSTCIPHLLVFVLFLSSAMFAYLKPTSESPSITNLVISVFYTMVGPTLNPVIYSLRNSTMKMAVGMLLGKCSSKWKSLLAANQLLSELKIIFHIL
ncbi:olfactory receptor 14A16-like [Sorex fumeus]|uniref:olfactory receptor 14A16-like n=1 Tax=Sorex fumeus TaxID=62283 RepID=UPI0024AE7656|nr:olfactory receptor 14A16-like [Sorex fumeus]